MRLSEFKNLITNMPVMYQGFTSKKATWAKYMTRIEAGEALRSIFGDSNEVTVSRSDLRRLANQPNLAQFAMGTIIWGYPRGMRGNHVANLTNDLRYLTNLLSTAREQPITDWETHYQAVEQISGIGLSTYTKFLNFLSARVHEHTALILDERIIRIAAQGVFEELEPIQHLTTYNAVRSYPQYLSCMHALENSLAVSAENIEFFLFEFGLNLKPILAQHL